MNALRDTAAAAQLARNRMAELLRTRGPAGLAWHCARNIGKLPQRLNFLIREATYDRRLGVQTSRLVAPEDLHVDPAKMEGIATGAGGIAYMPTPAWGLSAIFKELKIRYQDYTFIDLGSGMGRAVLMASTFPFARVVGVEFSPELHRIAGENLAASCGRRQAAEVELLCQDAREYGFPAGNCVLYMFNPFQGPVVRTVLENLRQALTRKPADVYVLYFNPVHGSLLDQSTFLRKVKSNRYYSIHRGHQG